MKTKILLFAILMSFTAIAVAQIIHVPADQPTIQAGIDAAKFADIVLVDDGTYYENITFKGKAITVASNFFSDGDTNHINNTIIDGSQPMYPDSASVVYFISREDTTSIIMGFTIKNGGGTPSSSWGNGICGGGIFCAKSGPSIENNKIINNTCEGGGQVLSGGGIFSDTCYNRITIIRNNLISGNKCISSDPSTAALTGGGVSAINDAIITNNTITNNSILYDGPDGKAFGGGVECSFSKPILRNNIITNNTIEITGNSYVYGGGIYGEDMQEGSIIAENQISGNMVIGDIHNCGGGIGLFNNDGKVTIDRNIIDNNHSKQGAGIHFTFGNEIEITNNLIRGNNASLSGGGIYVQYYTKKSTARGDGRITNSLSQTMELKRDLSPVITNNTIVENFSNDYGGAIVYDLSHPLIAFNNIIYDNAANTGVEIYLKSYSDAHLFNNNLDTNAIHGNGNWKVADNIFCDPEFEDGNCHLLWSSCCIGRGVDSIEVSNETYYCPDHDLDGEERPFGTYVDIGADESPFWVEIREENYGDDKVNLLVFPNPLSSSAIIEYDLIDQALVELKIYNYLGKEIDVLVSEFQKAGTHQSVWNAEGLPVGVYFYRLTAGPQVGSGKIIKR